jgi:hypothetical protein
MRNSSSFITPHFFVCPENICNCYACPGAFSSLPKLISIPTYVCSPSLHFQPRTPKSDTKAELDDLDDCPLLFSLSILKKYHDNAFNSAFRVRLHELSVQGHHVLFRSRSYPTLNPRLENSLISKNATTRDMSSVLAPFPLKKEVIAET